MSHDDSYGIRIGEDKWISWIDYDASKEVNIDLKLVPLDDLWRQLETNCVAYCCRLDAFDFTPANIERAGEELADPSLSQKLTTLRNEIAASNDYLYDSTRFNCTFHRDVLIQLIDHVAAHIQAC
jgi:hypothetical protein